MGPWFARFDWQDEAARDAARAVALPGRLYRAEDDTQACVYAAERPEAGPLRWTRIEPLLDRAGAAAGHDARWHYIVATDVVAAHEADFNAWYDTEHLPGLAAVPGVARALRGLASGADAPRYHACYDLAERAAFNGPAWLAVRGTPWSDRVRPHFRNTVRTMVLRMD